MVEVESMHFSSSKDKNHVLASRVYFGVIEGIMDIDYVTFKVHLFKCKWIDNNTGVDELKFTLVDLRKATYMNKPFIMASQAKQFFYITDPSNTRWSIVIQWKHIPDMMKIKIKFLIPPLLQLKKMIPMMMWMLSVMIFKREYRKTSK